MIQSPPVSTRRYPLFPDPTLSRPTGFGSKPIGGGGRSDKPTSLRISPLQGREGEPGLPKTKRPRKSAGACVSNIFRPRLTRRSALGNRRDRLIAQCLVGLGVMLVGDRSEEHTSELQSLLRISYAVF